ncbi:MAG: hypothetical protein HC820_03280 [Hydrococcus sp. RM1_1_31]|nr:hypothetical protein [Hydrococcus sp. RM1_1_31]
MKFFRPSSIIDEFGEGIGKGVGVGIRIAVSVDEVVNADIDKGVNISVGDGKVEKAGFDGVVNVGIDVGEGVCVGDRKVLLPVPGPPKTIKYWLALAASMPGRSSSSCPNSLR